MKISERRRGVSLADVDRPAVLKAVREFDRIGEVAFLKQYGFRQARGYFLVHDGQRYPSKAIMGVAYGYQFPDRGPLSGREFSGGEQTVFGWLDRLGFTVTQPGDTQTVDDDQQGDATDPEAEAFPEGELSYRHHIARERSARLVRLRKRQARGDLRCQACGFDFATVYGPLGEGYIECHHVRPVSELRAGETTRVQDLALVCANCHRMLHRRRPWLGMDALAGIIAQRRGPPSTGRDPARGRR